MRGVVRKEGTTQPNADSPLWEDAKSFLKKWGRCKGPAEGFPRPPPQPVLTLQSLSSIVEGPRVLMTSPDLPVEAQAASLWQPQAPHSIPWFGGKHAREWGGAGGRWGGWRLRASERESEGRHRAEAGGRLPGPEGHRATVSEEAACVEGAATTGQFIVYFITVGCRAREVISGRDYSPLISY